MLIPPAMAQTAPAASASSDMLGGAGLVAFLPYLLIFAVMYFLLIRPQQRRMKEHRAKVEGIVRNDQVVTSGGIVGKVTRVDDEYAEVEIAKGVTVKVVKATISEVLSTTAKPAND